MPKFILALLTACLAACASNIEQNANYHVEHYLEASTDDSIAKWRQANNIGRDALVAIYPDGKFEIVETITRTRYIQPNINHYINDFVPCYLNMRGIYQAKPVILQAPCDRDPERYRRFGASTGFSSGIGIGFGSGGYRGAGIGLSLGF